MFYTNLISNFILLDFDPCPMACLRTLKVPFKVVDSCRIFSTKWSDTFRSFLCMEWNKNLSKTCHNRAKNSPSLGGGGGGYRKNTIFELSGNLIRKACSQVTLNARKS